MNAAVDNTALQTNETAITLAHERALAARANPGMQRIEEHPDWPLLSRLPMRLIASIPLARFNVRDLLALRTGHTVESAWTSTDDVPIRIGAVQLSWSEFEVVEGKMAVRLTRLA